MPREKNILVGVTRTFQQNASFCLTSPCGVAVCILCCSLFEKHTLFTKGRQGTGGLPGPLLHLSLCLYTLFSPSAAQRFVSRRFIVVQPTTNHALTPAQPGGGAKVDTSERTPVRDLGWHDRSPHTHVFAFCPFLFFAHATCVVIYRTTVRGAPRDGPCLQAGRKGASTGEQASVPALITVPLFLLPVPPTHPDVATHVGVV